MTTTETGPICITDDRSRVPFATADYVRVVARELADDGSGLWCSWCGKLPGLYCAHTMHDGEGV